MTQEELYDYKIHTIRGRFQDLKEDCQGIYNLSFFLTSIIVLIGIIIDIFNHEMWKN